MKDLNMCINFGFVGLQNGTMPDAAREKVIALMKEYAACGSRYNKKAYGFSGNPVQCNIYSSDIFCNQELFDIAEKSGCKANIITSSYGTEADRFSPDTVIALDIKAKSLSYPNTAAEYMVNKSDAVFLMWDGKQNLQDGILWTVLQFCKHKKIPYYLVNTARPEDVSFSSDAYYVPYTTEHVEQYVAGLYDYQEAPEENKPIFLSGLWKALHDRFIRKYKLKAKNIPYVEDKILSPDYFPQDDKRKKNHTMLTEYFAYYDQKAVDASTMYRASVYFRSILPFLTTIFIAVGFYAETVLTFIAGKWLPVFKPNFLAILAGVGFLIHALLNWYAGQMAKNSSVERLRKEYIEARFIAEYLRVVIHSEVYGIQVDSINMNDALVEKRILAKLHHIIRQQEPVSYVQTKAVMDEAVANFEALIADQKVYHENCINRYSLITRHLKKTASVVAAAGITIVIARGFLQFVIPFASVGLNLSGQINGVRIDSFIKSFANMLALVVPAWASYFSAKLSMNNYEWLRNDSIQVKAGLAHIAKRLEDVKKRNNNSYQVISDIANDIMALTREDYTGWYLRTGAQGFTRL